VQSHLSLKGESANVYPTMLPNHWPCDAAHDYQCINCQFNSRTELPNTSSFSEASVPNTTKSAIENAIGKWNSKSDSTGVVFDPAPAGTSGDLEFKRSDNPDDTGGFLRV
jgi:hypothetical protein